MADPKVVRRSDRRRRLRVAFVMEQVLGHVTVYRNLRKGVESLDEVDARWVETTMFDEHGVLERMPGIPGFVRASARAWIDLRRGLRGWRPDVLVFNSQKAAAFCQWDLISTPTILMTDVTPVQLDAMAEQYDHPVERLPGLSLLKHRANVLNFRLARAVVPTSGWTGNSLIHDYGVPADKIQINPVGLDTTYWRPDERRKPSERVQLLFVGGHFERKGGKLLLDVFRSLGLADRADLHIVTRDRVQAEPGVIVHGEIQYESPAFLRAYQQADVFVLPTLADCFTNVSLEATAVGLPIVATVMGGLPDIVEHGNNGYLVPPGDGQKLGEALLNLIDNHHGRLVAGVRARERALALFDARRNAARLLELAHAIAGVSREAHSLPNLNSAASRPRPRSPIFQEVVCGAVATAHPYPGGASDGAAS